MLRLHDIQMVSSSAITTLQELITRGRHVMANAPSRLRVFEAVDGRRTAAEIAGVTGRHVNNVRTDLGILRDVGLIHASGSRNPVYSKDPLARSIGKKYFESTRKRPSGVTDRDLEPPARRTTRRRKGLPVPTAGEVLEIAKSGEDQLHEFKSSGVETSKLTREVAAMLHNSEGGMIFYGIDDDGTISGSDVPRQKLDQSLQNSIKNGISPSASIKLGSVSVLGNEIIVIVVPPWNKREVYQFQERILIRKGTNVFAATSDEIRSLYEGNGRT